METLIIHILAAIIFSLLIYRVFELNYINYLTERELDNKIVRLKLLLASKERSRK